MSHTDSTTCRRARSVGVYRLWRDGGFAIGALLAGGIADLVGLDAAEGPGRGKEGHPDAEQEQTENQGGEDFAQHDAGRSGALQQQQVQRAALAFPGEGGCRDRGRDDRRGEDDAQPDRAKQEDRHDEDHQQTRKL